MAASHVLLSWDPSENDGDRRDIIIFCFYKRVQNLSFLVKVLLRMFRSNIKC